MVSAPCRISSLPTAVEPVNEIMSTRGSVPSIAATSLDGVGTTLTTPAGMSVCSAIKPAEPGRVPRRVRIGLEHDGIAGGQRRAELVEDDLDREVRRRDRGDDADRLLDDGAHVALAEQSAAVECAFPLEVVDQPARGSAALRRAASRVERTVSSSPGSRPRRSAPRAGPPSRPRSPTAVVPGTACAVRGWSTSRFRRRPCAPLRLPGPCPAA